MIFPFRTSTIFRNRWVALLWAAGICFMAAEVVDSVSGVTTKHDKATSSSSAIVGDPAGPVATDPANAPASPVIEDRIAR